MKIVGVESIYEKLMEIWVAGSSFAIHDDYWYWSDNDLLPCAGKLMLVDEADTKIHQIFFDDNIDNDPEFSIVDIRNKVTGITIPYKTAINTYMVQVDTLKAITDENYFIKKLAECEKKRIERLGRLVLLNAKVNELKKLEEVHPSIKPIIPLIYQGLENIFEEAPEDPIKALAQFLLNNRETN